MKRMIVGAVAALALAGCGTGEAPSEVSTGLDTTSSIQTTSSVASTPPPATEPESTPAPQLETTSPTTEVPPPIDVADPSNRPTGEQLYLETCQQFIATIDALAVTGAPREVTVNGISEQLQANPSWATVPEEDQHQMLRGLDAAGQGSC